MHVRAEGPTRVLRFADTKDSRFESVEDNLEVGAGCEGRRETTGAFVLTVAAFARCEMAYLELAT